MKALARRLWRCRSGQVTTEYMLLIVVIVIQLVLAFNLLVPNIREGFMRLAERIIEGKP